MTTKLTDEKLREMLAASRKATPGPWHWEEPIREEWHESDPPQIGWLKNRDDIDVLKYAGCSTHGCEKSDGDAAYIAVTSPDTIAPMIEELLASRQLLASIWRRAGSASHQSGWEDAMEVADWANAHLRKFVSGEV